MGYLDLESVINERRSAILGEDADLPIMSAGFTLPTDNNIEMDAVTDIDFYKVESDDGKIFCDSKQFLFQDIYKHVFLIGKRGIGKTYSVHDYVISQCVKYIREDLPNAIKTRQRASMQLPINVAYLLQNTLYNGPLIKTLNEILANYSLNDYVTMEVISYTTQKMAIEVSVDLGGSNKFIKAYSFGECFYLTLPNLARGRQFNDTDFVIFDEFEKAFAQSLLDENKVRVDTDKLFDNFKDLMNSFQRNDKIRFLYMGNITNLNSIIWDFLEIVNFDFEYQINEHDDEKVLILNLIPLFTNQSMSNYFEDATTLGISEEELFKLNGMIDEKNIIEDLTSDSFIVFDDMYIYYFDNGICNVERVTMKNMEALNEQVQREFVHQKIVEADDDELMTNWLEERGIDNNEHTRLLVPLQELQHEQTIDTVTRIKVYSVGKLLLDDTIHVDDTKMFFKPFRKDTYKFRSLREYFIFAHLIGY